MLIMISVLLLCATILATIAFPAVAQNIDREIEQAVKSIYQREPGDADVVAVVNGRPVTRGAVRAAFVATRLYRPGLPEEQAYREGFRLVSRSVVAEVEAQRRGIQVTREEAASFTNFQRRLYEQGNIKARLPFTEAIRNSGLGEEEFWGKQVDVYAKTLLVAKLRNAVKAEVADLPQDE